MGLLKRTGATAESVCFDRGKRAAILLVLLLLPCIWLAKPSVVKADSWTSVTLPCTITQSGNYRLTSSWTGTGNPLEIDASNVIFDAQGYLINLTSATYGNIGVRIDASNDLVENAVITGGFHGFYAAAVNNFTIQNSEVNCSDVGVEVTSSNDFVLDNCTFSNMVGYGVYAGMAATVFSIENTEISNVGNVGAYLASCVSFNVNNLLVNNCTNTGLDTFSATNFSVTNSTFENVANSFGVFSDKASNFVIRNSNFLNDKFGMHANQINNGTIAANVFSGDGAEVYNTGAFESGDSNCTVTDNVFIDNFNAYIFAAYNSNQADTVTCYNNIFNDDNFTFWFDYERASTDANLQLVFYNNIVNDSDVIEPSMYMPSNPSVLSFNTTLQQGSRICGAGYDIGGNFWANPMDTGFSQTGVDNNHDGFIDSAYNIYGGYYDYYPLSLNYTATISRIDITPLNSAVTAGSTQAFSATAYDQLNSSLGDVSTAVSWSIQAGAGGSWSGATYTSQNPGAWTVTAAYSGVNATTQLTVNPKLTPAPSITPNPANTPTPTATQTPTPTQTVITEPKETSPTPTPARQPSWWLTYLLPTAVVWVLCCGALIVAFSRRKRKIAWNDKGTTLKR